MADRVPSTFLLVPGPWASAKGILQAIRGIEPDARQQWQILRATMSSRVLRGGTDVL